MSFLWKSCIVWLWTSSIIHTLKFKDCIIYNSWNFWIITFCSNNCKWIVRPVSSLWKSCIIRARSSRIIIIKIPRLRTSSVIITKYIRPSIIHKFRGSCINCLFSHYWEWFSRIIASLLYSRRPLIVNSIISIWNWFLISISFINSNNIFINKVPDIIVYFFVTNILIFYSFKRLSSCVCKRHFRVSMNSVMFVSLRWNIFTTISVYPRINIIRTYCIWETSMPSTRFTPWSLTSSVCIRYFRIFAYSIMLISLRRHIFTAISVNPRVNIVRTYCIWETTMPSTRFTPRSFTFLRFCC